MSFSMTGRTLDKIGIVGSGQIGPDIALHFTKFFAPLGVPVVVVDIADEALASGRAKVEKKVGKGVKAGAFTEDGAAAMLKNLTFTSDYNALAGAGLIIEAATENLDVKRKVFLQLRSLLGPDAILASNSSHMTPDVIFEGAENTSHTLVIHYFFPAERNPLVEIVPSADTDPGVTDFLMRFYEIMGKMPIQMGSRYGFGVDPVFEGITILACKVVEAGICSVKQADAIAQKAVGLGVGPFTAMNLTGGNALVYPGASGYHDHVMPFFEAPASMGEKLEKKEPWPTAGRGEEVEFTDEMFTEVGDIFRGTFFALAADVVDAKVSTVGDLDMAVETGMVVKAPFTFMNKIGVPESLAQALKAAARFPGVKIPALLRDQAASGKPWDVPTVFRRDYGDVAVVKIMRPKVLNALNSHVMAQLKEVFTAIQSDDGIRAAVLTGFGTKSFISGADIRELARLAKPAEAEQFARNGQSVLDLIENLGKPVVAAMNGLAFGGGSETAMACSARLAAKGQRMFAGQPEPKLGIIPGYGGSQRFVRWIGFEKAWPILRTGNPISSAQAVELGFATEEVDRPALLDRAIELARDAAGGKVVLPSIPRDPVAVPDAPAEVDIGHLSQAIDGIMQKAILEGARMTLADGLAHEAKMFGECILTKDMKIGMDNFIQNGPKAKATFLHA